MLYKQPNMRHVKFEATSLGPAAAGAVASALAAGCAQLEHLNISSCDITPEGVPAVAKAISAMKNLKVLNIAENELGDFGVAQICVALKMSVCPLQDLELCPALSPATFLKDMLQSVTFDNVYPCVWSTSISGA